MVLFVPRLNEVKEGGYWITLRLFAPSNHHAQIIAP